MIQTISSKLPNMGTTIFTVMSKLAQEHQALNLAQGFPDFPCDAALVERVSFYLHQGKNQYAPMPGILPLREKLSRKTEELYGASYDPETEVTVTCGATEACFVAITALVQTGDEVLIFEPAFDVYHPAILMCGGVPVYTSLKAPDYSINWEDVRSKITSRTKLIILNTPHNPTGAVISSADIAALTEIIEQYPDVYILSDEVYEHLVFDGKRHESLSRYPKLKERSLVICSLGKTFHVTGWRMGYCLAPRYLSAEFRKVHQYVTFSAATPMQFAINDFLDSKEKYLELPEFFQKKRDLFLSLLKKSRWEILPSEGTYFQLLGYKQISDESDLAFAERLTKEKGIASIPVSVFYHQKTDLKVLRFCFAKEEETLIQAANILCRI